MKGREKEESVQGEERKRAWGVSGKGTGKEGRAGRAMLKEVWETCARRGRSVCEKENEKGVRSDEPQRDCWNDSLRAGGARSVRQRQHGACLVHEERDMETHP